MNLISKRFKPAVRAYKTLGFEAKLSLGFTILGIIIAVLAWQLPKQISPPQLPAPLGTASVAKHINIASLAISASSARVRIEEGLPNMPFRNTSITASSSDHTFYLPKGQPLLLRLTGSSIRVSVAAEIAKQIQTQDNGASNRITIN